MYNVHPTVISNIKLISHISLHRKWTHFRIWSSRAWSDNFFKVLFLLDFRFWSPRSSDSEFESTEKCEVPGDFRFWSIFIFRVTYICSFKTAWFGAKLIFKLKFFNVQNSLKEYKSRLLVFSNAVGATDSIGNA